MPMIKLSQVGSEASPAMRRFPILTPDEKEKLEREFAEAEASLRLEGMTPSENFFAAKARVLDGKISLDQGFEEILAWHRTRKIAVA